MTRALALLEARFERTILELLLSSMALILVSQVFMRYVMRSPFVWSEEVARYLLIWCTFIGVSLAVRQSRHIRVDALALVLGPIGNRILAYLALFGMLVFCAVIVFYGYDVVDRIRMIGQTSPSLGIPMWWIYAAAPVGFGLAFLRTIQALWALSQTPIEAAEPARPAES